MIFPQKLNFKEDFINEQINKIHQHIEEDNYKEIEEIIDYIIISKEYHDQLDDEKRTFLEEVYYWALISQNKYYEAFEKMGFFKIKKEDYLESSQNNYLDFIKNSKENDNDL